MTQSQFVSRGDAIDFIPNTDVPEGAVVAVGQLVGVTKRAIASGERGSIALAGVFDVVKDPSTNIPAGTKLYWSQVSLHVVKTASTHPLLGIAVEDAPPGTTTVRVRLTQ